MSATALTFTPATAASPTLLVERESHDEWHPTVGDQILIDTQNNVGYLVHPDGRFLRFLIVTGQRKFVCYIGRCYNAATPNWNWIVKSKHIKGDRITFGPTGRFIRLYKDGDEHTAYGIHEYAYEDTMFSRNKRFGSMGCIIVKQTMMDVIEKTYDLNEGYLPVITQFGLDQAYFAYRMPKNS